MPRGASASLFATQYDEIVPHSRPFCIEPKLWRLRMIAATAGIVGPGQTFLLIADQSPSSLGWVSLCC